MAIKFFSRVAGLLCLAILLNGVEARNDSAMLHDPLENTCEFFDIYAETYAIVTHDNVSHHQPLDKPIEMHLYRLCNSSRTIDFSIPVQKLIFCKGYDNEFFGHQRGADRFVATLPQFTASGIGPASLSNYFNVTDEELDRNECFIMKATLESHLPGIIEPENDNYVDADIVHIDSEEVREKVRITPGYLAGLESNVMRFRTMIPLSENSTLKERNVTIMASWFRIREDVEGLHAVIDRKYMKQYITIFYEHPDYNNTRLFPGHVNASLMDPPGSNIHYHGEIVQLYPGWIGELSPRGSNQTLIRHGDSDQMIEKEVTVFPRYHSLFEGEGLHATYDLIYARTIITIYYKDEPSDD